MKARFHLIITRKITTRTVRREVYDTKRDEQHEEKRTARREVYETKRCVQHGETYDTKKKCTKINTARKDTYATTKPSYEEKYGTKRHLRHDENKLRIMSHI